MSSGTLHRSSCCIAPFLIHPQVSKRLRDIIATAPQLQYNVELAVAGYVDNGKNDLQLTEKLRLLQETQTAWKRARFSLGPGLPYEQAWSYAGNVLHADNDFMSLEVSGANLASRRWIIDPGMPEFCFLLDSAVDPAQDVAVFLGQGDEEQFMCVMPGLPRALFTDGNVYSFRRLSLMRLSNGISLFPKPIPVPALDINDVRAELKTFDHMVAVIRTGIPNDDPMMDNPGRSYSVVVTIYSIRTGTILTVSYDHTLYDLSRV